MEVVHRPQTTGFVTELCFCPHEPPQHPGASGPLDFMEGSVLLLLGRWGMVCTSVNPGEWAGETERWQQKYTSGTSNAVWDLCPRPLPEPLSRVAPFVAIASNKSTHGIRAG